MKPSYWHLLTAEPRCTFLWDAFPAGLLAMVLSMIGLTLWQPKAPEPELTPPVVEMPNEDDAAWMAAWKE